MQHDTSHSTEDSPFASQCTPAAQTTTTSPSAVSNALSTAYTSLPADLFFSIIQLTVLPHLERLTAEDQDRIREAFDEATRKEEAATVPLVRENLEVEGDGDVDKELRARVDELHSRQASHDPSAVLPLIQDLLALSRPISSPSTARWATSTAARLTLASASASPSTTARAPFLATLLSELTSSISAITSARSNEFRNLASALKLLEGSEDLLDELPEVQLGAAGWQEKEKERRRMEMTQELLLEEFSEALRPEEEDQVESRGVWGELQREAVPIEGDRRMGDRLMSWWEVWVAWPDRGEAEEMMRRLQHAEIPLLQKPSVVEVLCSLVRKKRRGYDPDATDLRDGMWVMVHVLSQQVQSGGIPRLGLHY